MNRKRTISAAMAVVMCAAALASCGVKDMKDKSTSITYPSNGTYPLKCNDTLTVWSNSLDGDMTTSPRGVQWKEETGVDIEWIQPMNGSQEALSLMLSSDELPDVILAGLANEPGGIQKFADDKVIIPLNDYLEKYAPAYNKVLNEDPDLKKQLASDDGKIYNFTCLAPASGAFTSCGLVIRRDLLKKVGLEVPETIDEWHEALTAFKDMGMEAPLSYQLMVRERGYGVFMGAYGVKAGFYLDDEGKIRYGVIEPEMKDAVANLAKWYDEGLLDRNIVQGSDLDANILNSQTGASVVWAGSGLGKYMSAMEETDPEFDLAPAKFPVLNKGDTPKFGSRGFRITNYTNGFITTACKNVELAMRFLDYGYTDEGHLMMCFGKEGVSYTMVDGEPVYTDLILHNPDGLSISDAMLEHIFASGSGPFVSDERYMEQYYQHSQQKEALTVWGDSTAPKNTVPPLSFTTDESARLSEIMANVETTCDEMIFKYIMGLEPMDKFDDLVNTIKGFGIEEAIDIYQAALDRYNKK